MEAISETDDKVILRLRVVPNAKRTELVGLTCSELKIRLHAPPVDGKANKELVKFLAKTLGVRKSAVAIRSGESSRSKTLIIAGIDKKKAESLLLS
jgi:uncharacterized protein (TIGR00251 family)